MPFLASRHAKQKAQQGDFAEAAAVLSKHGASGEAVNFELYKHVVGGVLALTHSEESQQGELDCKDFLWQLVQPALGVVNGPDLPVKVGNDFISAMTSFFGFLSSYLTFALSRCFSICL